ncbi:MAG TPA: PH domain-containing protein [Thiotrichales bacterium]|nr:PH domain-containing protein [Thiotrichales bacterium]
MATDKKIYLRPAWRVLFLSHRLYIGLLLLILTFVPWFQLQLLQLRASNFVGLNWDHDFLFWIRVAGVGIVALVLLLTIVYRLRWRYMIGPEAIESMRGLIGRDERRVEYRNIRYVRFYQSLFQRLFLIGDVMVGTAATDDPEVTLYDVPNPGRWKKWVQEKQRLADKRSNETG